LDTVFEPVIDDVVSATLEVRRQAKSLGVWVSQRPHIEGKRDRRAHPLSLVFDDTRKITRQDTRRCALTEKIIR
jgi:hypothetical protein